MRRQASAAACLLASGAIFAASGKLPVDEDAVVREVEALIDQTPPPTDAQMREAAKLVQHGTQAHDAKRYQDALADYRKALAIFPVDATAYYEMAYTQSEMGDQTAALDSVIRALTLDPKSEGTYVLKGNVLDDLGFTEEAKKTYLALLDVQPKSYLGLINLAVCELRLSDTAAAKEHLTKARDLEPNRPSAYFHLAKVASATGCNYDEEAALEKFLEVGKNDPRGPVVKKRLDELRRHDVTVDMSGPYSSIDTIEQIARVAWRTTKHKTLHPEACGYRLTFDEEKDILGSLVLPEWRKEKAKNPSASQPDYDLLLKIDDAGFLDEYIYDTKRGKIGDTADAWLAAHADRKKAFEDWARQEGLLAKDKPEPAESQDLSMEIITLMSASKVHYVLDQGDASDSARFLALERKRFRDGLKLRGADTVDCSKTDRDNHEEFVAAGAMALTPLFRCRAPGDDAFAATVKQVSLLGLEVRDLAPAVEGGVFSEKDGVHLKVVNPSWLGYVSAKAAWRNEPDLRRKHGGSVSDQPSVEEEVFAFRAAVAAYRNGRQPDDKEETFAPVESLERLSEIEKAGRLRGFVLYEVLHRRYGMVLSSLTAEDARAVEEYLLAHVFVRATPH